MRLVSLFCILCACMCVFLLVFKFTIVACEMVNLTVLSICVFFNLYLTDVVSALFLFCSEQAYSTRSPDKAVAQETKGVEGEF